MLAKGNHAEFSNAICVNQWKYIFPVYIMYPFFLKIPLFKHLWWKLTECFHEARAAHAGLMDRA